MVDRGRGLWRHTKSAIAGVQITTGIGIKDPVLLEGTLVLAGSLTLSHGEVFFI